MLLLIPLDYGTLWELVIRFTLVSLVLEYEACHLDGVQEVISYRLTEWRKESINQSNNQCISFWDVNSVDYFLFANVSGPIRISSCKDTCTMSRDIQQFLNQPRILLTICCSGIAQDSQYIGSSKAHITKEYMVQVPTSSWHFWEEADPKHLHFFSVISIWVFVF